MATFNRFRKIDQLPFRRTCWFCPSKVQVQTHQSVWEHNLENHFHLLFQCLDEKCNNIDLGKPVITALGDNKDFNTTKLRSYVTIEEVMLHLKEFHGIYFSTTQFRLKSEVLKEVCALPKDLRKAECMNCRKLILCRNEFQIKRHRELAHEMATSIKYGCRVCLDFHTWSESHWNNHFTAKDYSSCQGLHFDEMNAQQNITVRTSKWPERYISEKRYYCNLCDLDFKSAKHNYLQHVRGRRHKDACEERRRCEENSAHVITNLS